MYELLFRSRWYALGWAVLMAVSALTFTTIGAGAWLTAAPDPHASEVAREQRFRAWAEDGKRGASDETGYDPSSPELVRDGYPRRDDGSEQRYRTAPFSPDDASNTLADSNPAE